MKLWATSDLHVGFDENRRAVEALPAHPDDWLIVAGDTGETPAHLDFVLRTLNPRFKQLVWAPGNHDLWTPREWPPEKRGVPHYERLVSLCRRYGVLTPEDPYARWPGDGPLRAIVPTFLLFDYSFRPDTVARKDAVAWAARLTPAIGRTRTSWRRIRIPLAMTGAHARVTATEARLEAVTPEAKLILVNHFPLLHELAIPPRIPRFSIWCGTTRTADWHRRFPIEVAVSGHLHLRSTREIDGVRFEEVSLGYPKQWNQCARPRAVSPAHPVARVTTIQPPIPQMTLIQLPVAARQAFLTRPAGGRNLCPRFRMRAPLHTLRMRSAAAMSVSSFFAKQKRSTGPPVSL